MNIAYKKLCNSNHENLRGSRRYLECHAYTTRPFGSGKHADSTGCARTSRCNIGFQSACTRLRYQIKKNAGVRIRTGSTHEDTVEYPDPPPDTPLLSLPMVVGLIGSTPPIQIDVPSGGRSFNRSGRFEMRNRHETGKSRLANSLFEINQSAAVSMVGRDDIRKRENP